MRRIWLVLVSAQLFGAAPAMAQLQIFGPGGPAPALREAAQRFEQQTGNKVEIVSGPTAQWVDRARAEADIVYSGSDTMMTEFVRALPDLIEQSAVVPLYDRPAAILVRKGNPRRIRGFRDLTRADITVMVVEGAGQNGLWEDLASRAGGIDFLRRFRPRIARFAPNSAAARDAWTADPEIDAWVIWNIWQAANPAIADQVAIEPDIALYRSVAVAVTRKGRVSATARAFADFLSGPEATRIFRRFGWRAPTTPR